MSLQVLSGISRTISDTWKSWAHLDTTYSVTIGLGSKFDISFVTPSSVPGIFDKPVVTSAGVNTVSDGKNSVVETSSAF